MFGVMVGVYVGIFMGTVGRLQGTMFVSLITGWEKAKKTTEEESTCQHVNYLPGSASN